MQALTWKQDGVKCVATVGLLSITINYQEQNRYVAETGYYVWVSGRWSHRKVKPYPTLEAAKEAGIKLLRKEARDILKVIEAVK